MFSIDWSVWGTCGFGSHAVQRLSSVSAMREDVRSAMERAVWSKMVILALRLQEIQCQFDNLVASFFAYVHWLFWKEK